ncbi:MAG TPA: Wzz/FepE/Etk N-terminal domain-containing protein [Pilimelia sp.]|nr:Wzz/FepE/Etk N-terminal domain-containing protein [Pilimelia sp.]
MADADGATLATYLGWLRRRWWILMLFAALGAVGALLVTQMQPRAYTSTTSVLVRQISLDAAATPAKANLDTEAQVVRSLVVAERARKLMSSSTPADQLVRTVTVTVPPNSQVLLIAYEARTPQLAQSGSHAFAQAYLDLKLDDAKRRVETEVANLRTQIAEVRKQLGVVTGRIAAAPANSVQRESAEADRAVLTNQLTSLNAKLSPLLAPALDPGEIISDARLPTRPSSPNRTLNLASGLGAGLLFGIVLSLLLDRLDTRVRRTRDIADRLGLPVLLELPDRVQSLTLLPPTHRVSRELGRLRNVLLTTVPPPRVRGNGRQLLLTDASAGSAAGYVAGNLAAAYARTGQQVAVVTTKPDSPLTVMLEGARSRYGLADVLRRDVTALKALTPAPGLSHLRVLLPGKLNAEEELPVAAMLEVLSELAARFDHVLIETASPTLAVEAQALASHVDAVIVVAEAGRSRSGEIVAALRQFEQVEAPVLGAVLAPHMPGTGAKARVRTPRVAVTASPATATTALDVETTQVVAKPAAVKDRKSMMILPQPADSTIVLPRVKEAAGRDDAIPTTGNGQATTYRSSSDVNGSDGPARLRVALDSGEDLG